jgi:hypothetical protein
VSATATVIPWPRTPSFFHTFGAPMNGTLVSFVRTTIETGSTRATSARAASREAASVDIRTENAFTSRA